MAQGGDNEKSSPFGSAPRRALHRFAMTDLIRSSGLPFQWALDSCPDPLAVFDAGLGFVAANAPWREAFGPRQVVMGQPAADLLRQMGVASAAKARLHGAPVQGEPTDPVAAPNFSIDSWSDDSGAIAGVTVRCRASPLDERQQSELATRRLRLAMDMAQVIAFEFDFRSGACIYDPPDAAPPRKIRGFNDILGVLPVCEREAAMRNWEHHLLTGEVLVFEYEWVLPTGEPGWHMNACEAVRDEGGDVIGMIGMRQDITARKRAELAIVAEREAAKAADEAKSHFLANMSHEIRTPLNGVLAMAQVMAGDALEDAQRARLDVVRQSGEDLLHIINDILDVSKIEAGKLELESIVFDPVQVLESALASFAALAQRKGVQLRLDIGDDARGLREGDPGRLRQIVNNYLSNALKFTAEGDIRVGVQGVGTQGRDGLSVSVQDAGIGIPEAKMPMLFQKFSQVDASTTRQYGGTGLGLAICRQLASLMGGQVWAESREGQGSTFHVTLALPHRGEPASPPTPSTAPETLGASRALRILAAEDNRTNQLVLAAIIEVMGFELTLANNGREALETWRTGDFDVILMDVQMPEMDGVAATRAIRAIEASRSLPPIPIIALSANAFSHQVQEYLAAGMDAHVAKPIDLAALHAALQRAAMPDGPAPDLRVSG